MEEYIPEHNENKMNHERDVELARKRLIENRNNKIDFFISNFN